MNQPDIARGDTVLFILEDDEGNEREAFSGEVVLPGLEKATIELGSAGRADVARSSFKEGDGDHRWIVRVKHAPTD